MFSSDLDAIKVGALGSEASAWSTLRVHFAEAGCDIQRFEDKLTPGIPDANICYRGREFWLEGKFLRAYPKREASLVKVGLRDRQVLWAKKRDAAGGQCFVWVREPLGWRLLAVPMYDRLLNGIPLIEYKSCGVLYGTSFGLAEFLLSIFK